MKYKMKPVVIEAFQMTHECRLNNSEWPVWLQQAWRKPNTEVGALFCLPDECLDTMFIYTLEGTLKVSWGDWIIQGVEGELYPCKPKIFKATYKVVYEAPPPWADLPPGALW